MEDRLSAIRGASTLSLVGNAALAIAKISVGLVSGSLAVIGDGIDSSTDVVISIASLAAARYSAKPSDQDHPWGHGRAETIATVALAFIIFFAGAQLLVSALGNLVKGIGPDLPGALALWVTLVSILGKLLLAWNQTSTGKRVGSQLLLANGQNMRNDVIMSLAVLLGLLGSRLAGTPLVDAAVAVLVGLWVMRSAVGIFLESNTELMDGNADDGLYRLVFDAVRSVPGAGHPHRARVRRIAAAYDIDLDIEVDGDLSVREAHEIAGRVERAIKERIDSVYDIVVHVEPAGSGEHGEQFGLDEGKLGL